MTSKQWQLANDAALRYEEVLVPTILGPFAKALVDWADLSDGNTVIDVGCGTGAATRFAATKIGIPGQVIGADINADMLSVAQSIPQSSGVEIEWQQDAADKLSMGDNSADVVLCAQTLQFVGNRQDVLNEMVRILKPGKSAYISLWSDIAQNPYFDALVSTIAKYISDDTAAGLRSAFNLSNLDEIEDLIRASQFSDWETSASEITLNLPPILDFVPRHIRATPMGIGYNATSQTTQQAILDHLSEQLNGYISDSGIHVPFQSYLIRART